MPIDALGVLCAQFTRDLLAIAKFLSFPRFGLSWIVSEIKLDIRGKSRFFHTSHPFDGSVNGDFVGISP